MVTKYSLPDWTENTIYQGMRLTWKDEAGTAISLTGATLTGRIYNTHTKVASAIDGALTPDADQITNTGVFVWAMTAADVVDGTYDVQFIATYLGLPAKTFRARWYVENEIPAP